MAIESTLHLCTKPEFLAQHTARPGLIPVQLDPVHRTVLWMDLDQYHCYEGALGHSLACYKALKANASHPSEPFQCTSSLDVLNSPVHVADCIAPTAFIFHAGRCGSTLLAKVLARSRQHLVFGEGGPHNQVWRVSSREGDSAEELFRNLILHMGRRRLLTYQAHIVKFTSFNVVRSEVLRDAFPGVPTLFLFRNPVKILASYRRTSTAWMGVDTGIGKVWHSAEAAVTDFFHSALRAGGNLEFLDYDDLTPDILAAVLRFFGLDPPSEDIALMRAEFSWDAKAQRVWLPQAPTAAEFEPVVSQALMRLYEELRARAGLIKYG